MDDNSQVQYVQRFTIFPRFLHFLVIISFLTLAVTGMALKFASENLFSFLDCQRSIIPKASKKYVCINILLVKLIIV